MFWDSEFNNKFFTGITFLPIVKLYIDLYTQKTLKGTEKKVCLQNI